MSIRARSGTRNLAGGCAATLLLLLGLAALPSGALASAGVASAPARVQNRATLLRLLRTGREVLPTTPPAPTTVGQGLPGHRPTIAQTFPRAVSARPPWWPANPGRFAFAAYTGPQKPFPISSDGYLPTGEYMPSVGRLYGLRPDGVSWDLCSAAVVAPDIIMTAAHCVFDLEARQENQGWAFVPKMKGKAKQSELWTGKRAAYWQMFANSPNTALDYAFIRMQPRSGRNIGSVTGVNRILEYESPKRIDMQGYPASGPFAKRCTFKSCYVWYCDSPLGGTHQDPYGTELGMGCKTGEGASGGPWFMPYKGGWAIGSVVSTGKVFGSQNYARNIWGPRFTKKLNKLLNFAEK
jgi:V8-like Glu-specific endopeptidase